MVSSPQALPPCSALETLTDKRLGKRVRVDSATLAPDLSRQFLLFSVRAWGSSDPPSRAAFVWVHLH